VRLELQTLTDANRGQTPVIDKPVDSVRADPKCRCERRDCDQRFEHAGLC
jgi:hypothetical protein